MPKDERLEGAVGKASELEKNYDWFGAAGMYEKRLSLLPQKDFSGMGEIHERSGYAYYRFAFQAENNNEFLQRLYKAIDGYKQAEECYQKLDEPMKTGKALRCEAMVAYIGYWLAPDAPEKKRLINECWKSAKASLKAFEELKDFFQYGRTFNQLSSSVLFGFSSEWDFHTREKLIREAADFGEQAIKSLSTIEGNRELAKAYARTAFFFGVFDHYFMKADKTRVRKIRGYWQKAKEFSEEVALFEFLYPIDGAHFLLWGDGTEEALTNLKKALEYGRKTKDRLTIGCAFDWLTYHNAWTRWNTEDPEEGARVANTILQYAEDAKKQYSPLSFISPRADVYGVELRYADHYWFLGDRCFLADLEEKRGLLQKAREVALEGLKRATSSEYPELIGYAEHLLSNILGSLSWTEADSEKKREILEDAIEHMKQSIKFDDQFAPFDYWDRGIELINLGNLEYLLANLAGDSETKEDLQEHILKNEKALKFMMQGASTIGAPLATILFVGRVQYRIGVLLNRLYQLTNNQEHLRKAVKTFADATESFREIDQKSRIAECHWKIAQTYDALSEHVKAAENFQSASENYRLAAQKIPQLVGFYSDYVAYMRAWAEIERSRHERENENYTKSAEHYRMCSRRLEMTEKWSYLSSYYFAWSLLEHGEALSRLDKPQSAMKAFNEAGRTFRDSANDLREKVGELENSEETDEASKLANVARLRRQYCTGRVLMEEATFSNRKGDRISSAKKYATAAGIFKEIAPNLERKEAREELQFAAAICDAREKMELAEERGDAVLYKKAAELFAKAGEISGRKTAKLTAMGNSCFCEALELGMKFMATSNPDFYSGAKLRMENAAGYYQRAGFEKLVFWVEATKRLFDAYVYVGKAEAEVEPEKRVKFYLMAEKCLGLSAKFYGKTGYRGKKKEVLQNLEKVRKERQLSFSLNEILTVAAVLSSTTRVSMPDLTEKATGLNGFESVNIRASVSVPKEFVPSKEFEVKLDLANVGKSPGLLVRIEGLVPPRCKVLRVPSYCALEGSSLNMRGRRLDPLSVESVSVWVQIADIAGVSLCPSVVYVDEMGNFKTTRVEEVKILPVVEFESKVSQVVFNYLVDAFVEDWVKLRLGVDKSGWRSFPEIIKGAGVSKRSLYGAGGRLGQGVSELQRKCLVDLETLLGERGRGGHVLRVRIHHTKELVKRYVKEKAPNLAI